MPGTEAGRLQTHAGSGRQGHPWVGWVWSSHTLQPCSHPVTRPQQGSCKKKVTWEHKRAPSRGRGERQALLSLSVSAPGARVTQDKVRHTLRAGATEVRGEGRGGGRLLSHICNSASLQHRKRTGQKLSVLQGTLVKDADAEGWGDWRQDKEQLRPACPAAGIPAPPCSGQEGDPPCSLLLQPGDRSHLGVGWLSCQTSASHRPPAKRRAPIRLLQASPTYLRKRGLPKPARIMTSHPQEGNRVHAPGSSPQRAPCPNRSPPARGRCCRAEPLAWPQSLPAPPSPRCSQRPQLFACGSSRGAKSREGIVPKSQPQRRGELKGGREAKLERGEE